MVRMLLALLLVATVLARAEELTVRFIDLPVVPAQSEELLALPTGKYTEDDTGDLTSRQVSQPFQFEQRLAPDSPIILRYQGEFSLRNTEDPVDDITLDSQVTLVHRPSLIWEVTKSFQTSISYEQSTILNPRQEQTSFSNTVEWGIRSAGKALWTAAMGLQERVLTDGTMERQEYVKLSLDQPIVAKVVRVKVSNMLGLLESSAETDQSLVTGALDGALIVTPLQQTTWSTGALMNERGDDSSARGLYSQIEQKLTPQAAFRIRADYQKVRTDDLIEETRFLLGADTAVSFSDTLQGAIKLQQKWPGAEAVPLSETVLSLSLSGSF